MSLYENMNRKKKLGTSNSKKIALLVLNHIH